MAKIKKGDLVEVIAGNDRGVRGKVLKVFPRENRIIVEGVHFVKRHVRPTQRDPQGGIQEREAPIHISNVMLVCPNCGHPTRVGFKFMEDGTRVRVCRKCHEMIEA
ncbi:50S ribosomal protein L24 [bacterium]|nr:50S ribosomal protein L24 [bacterium]